MPAYLNYKTSVMKKKIPFTLLALISILLTFSFAIKQFKPPIPKVWDVEQLQSMHLPYTDTSIKLGFLSEELYNQLSERVSYKTYPFYMPGSEPKGYYDSLLKLEPVANFKEEDLKTEADWVKAGELIYELPMNYFPLDSAMLSLLPAMAERWKATGINTNKNGIIPFVTISIRKKGRPELATESCGMCHTKQMPDGEMIKGAQGNFIADRFRNIMAVTNLEARKASPERKLKVFHDFVKRLYAAPWIHNKYQDKYRDLKLEDIANSYFYGLMPGVQTRAGASFDHPISIPDLYNLKERKYLDKTGHNLNRGIGDIMRYAIVNQNMNMSMSYGNFIPDGDSIPTNAADYRKTGRFTDVQLFALAKFLYSLKPPPNPEKFSSNLLEKGKTIFIEQGCVSCHTPPLYTNNKLTPVDGFEPPAGHFKKYSIFNISVGTDPGLSLYTRRGSGYYKVPSLIGAWNRTAFLHDGHLANLEDLFDSARFSFNYEPTYFKPIGIKQMAVPGHPFGIELKPDEKKALVAFIKSL
jgi:hypothetical protein